MTMNDLNIWKRAERIRKLLGEDSSSPIDLFALTNSINGLSIVNYPMGENISGMCVKGKHSNVFAINSLMTLGRQRFTLAHELFHLYYDNEPSTSICLKNIGAGNEKEIQADQFASYLIMPPLALTEMIQKLKESSSGVITLNEVVFLEQYYQISRQAVLYRLIQERELSHQDAEKMRQNIIQSAINLGYDDTLYKPSPLNKRYRTYGHYIKLAEKVLEKGLVSRGKYEELLLEAFRSDLVYGEDIDEEILD
jgi:Zn-dependent peptidase ImmA (M78 family)